MIPGEVIVKDKTITINDKRKQTVINVKNTGDRPIQVGSHYHFFEVNSALKFDREKGYGKHLDIPAGAAVRFEPGDEKEVQLVEYAGRRHIYGFRNQVDGPIDEARVYRDYDADEDVNINKERGYER